MSDFNLDKSIRKIPDFPKKGITFYDITSLLADKDAYTYVINKLLERYKNKGITKIVSIESRGFIFGGAAAYELNLPHILARKKGKLPAEVYSAEYSLEYGTDSMEIHKEDMPAGENVLVIDDLIATGGTIKAACQIIEQAGSKVAGIFGVINLPFLKNAEKLKGYDVYTLQEYHSE